MKFFAGIIIVVLSTFIGYLHSQKYSEKKLFYTSMQNFNNKLKSEIQYSKKTIMELVSENKDDFFSNTAKKFYSEGRVKLTFKSTEDSDFVKNYLTTIGTSESKSQIDYLTKIDGEIGDKVKLSNENEKKYKSLSIKLGFLFGLMIFVLII